MSDTILDGRRAVVPGSFDPPTRGHLEVIRKASAIFARIHVAVAVNPQKRSVFSTDERIALLRAELEDLEATGLLEVTTFEGLTAEFAVRVGARWIVRGLRTSGDLEFELPMAWSNRHCAQSEVETLFLPASPETSGISSRLVREIAAAGGRLDAFVTPRVASALRARLRGGGETEST